MQSYAALCRSDSTRRPPSPDAAFGLSARVESAPRTDGVRPNGLPSPTAMTARHHRAPAAPWTPLARFREEPVVRSPMELTGCLIGGTSARQPLGDRISELCHRHTHRRDQRLGGYILRPRLERHSARRRTLALDRGLGGQQQSAVAIEVEPLQVDRHRRIRWPASRPPRRDSPVASASVIGPPSSYGRESTPRGDATTGQPTPGSSGRHRSVAPSTG
jgi:hypothetical protein